MKTVSQPNGKNGTAADRIAGLIDEPKKEIVRITQPNMKTIKLHLVGTAPYLQCRFPAKAIAAIRDKQQTENSQTKKAKLPPRNYNSEYLDSMHKISDKEYGMPASAFRSAAISACRLVNYKMTIAKLSIFIVADGYDVVDQTALVKINGKPQKHEMMGRNDNGVPMLRIRAIWPEWTADLRVKFDADQFTTSDVCALFKRIGQQVGVGEGRPDSKNSAGMGFGLFDVEF